MRYEVPTLSLYTRKDFACFRCQLIRIYLTAYDVETHPRRGILATGVRLQRYASNAISCTRVLYRVLPTQNVWALGVSVNRLSLGGFSSFTCSNQRGSPRA